MELKNIQNKLDDVRAMLEEYSWELHEDDTEDFDDLYVQIDEWLGEIHQIDIAMDVYTQETGQ